MADDTRETCQITRVVSLCKLLSRLTSLLQLISRVTWHGVLQFADNALYACGHNLRHMQLLGARTHNFLLFRAAITRVVALLQS